MKHALLKAPAAGKTKSGDAARTWGFTAAVSATVSAGIWLTIPTAPAPESAALELVAFRGGENIAHGNAGRTLDLNIDVSDLSPASVYRIQVVNAAGRQEWSGQAKAADSKLTVHVSKVLQRGLHWVRVSSESGEPLREFGLRTD